MVWYDKVRFLVSLFYGWYFLRKMRCCDAVISPNTGFYI
nr:MAG TPA: Protein of unknown function (DUF3149) [Caudoviricetes sp.]